MDKKVITHIFGHLLKKRLRSNYALQKTSVCIQPLIIEISRENESKFAIDKNHFSNIGNVNETGPFT